MTSCSVIIPNFNHAAFLEERIGSVINQELPPAEIIILDDHSSDNSREVIETFREHPLVKHIVYNDENSGSPFRQWARGIRMASSDWIWIAESDDAAEPAFLKTAFTHIKQHPGTGIFYSDSSCYSEGKLNPGMTDFSAAKNTFFHTNKWSSDYHKKGTDEINESLKWICSINNSSAALFRKDLLLELLQVLETFVYHGDWYCQLALALRSDVAYCASPLNRFRMHERSLLRKPDPMQSKLECFRILDFLYRHEQVTEKEKLVDFFTLQYLGFGFFSDGFRWGRHLFRNYSSVNKPLSKKVWASLIRQKISGKKHRKIF